jgi:hypothetical protein
MLEYDYEASEYHHGISEYHSGTLEYDYGISEYDYGEIFCVNSERKGHFPAIVPSEQ